jgi:hypothetical protein
MKRGRCRAASVTALSPSVAIPRHLQRDLKNVARVVIIVNDENRLGGQGKLPSASDEKYASLFAERKRYRVRTTP